MRKSFSGTKDPKVTEREIMNRAVAREAAAEGMVLLKNENNVLPLVPGSAVALYGTGASKTIKGGTGSGDVNQRDVVSIYEGMKAAGYEIANEAWIKDYDIQYDKERLAWRDMILAETEAKSGMHFFDAYTSHPFMMPAGGEVVKK